MAKRFTDSEKFKNPFIRGLQGAYKLLWEYILSDCDNAGIWPVDFEIAQIYLGADMKVNKADALKFFNTGKRRVYEIENGQKWFIPSFISFQYNELSKDNRAHTKIFSALNRLGLLNDDKLDLSPLQGGCEAPMVVVTAEGMETVKATAVVKEKNAPKNEIAIRVVEYYNQATGRNARLVESNFKPIRARLSEGLTEQDLYDIADFKNVEWTGTDNERHLTIETLFGNKAEKYRTQVQNAKDKGLTAAQIKGKPNGNGVDHTNLRAEALAAGFKMFKK